MNAPSFGQFAQSIPNAAQPQPAPGYAPQGVPPGFAPGPAPVAPAAPQAPAQQAPGGFAPPVYAHQAAPAGFGQPPQGFAPQVAPAPAPAYAPNPYAQAPVPVAPVAAGSNAFGKGAFAGATPMTGQLDCAPGTYLLEFVSTGQDKTKDSGKLIWRMKYKVLHVFEGMQPVGSEVTDAEFMADDRQRQYAAAAMLDISTKAMGCQNEIQLKQGLDGCLPPGVADQLRAQLPPGASPGWSEFADALQSSTQVQSQYFPPNPLAGKRILARVSLGAPVNKPGTKQHGKQYTQFDYAIAPAVPQAGA